MSNHWFGTPYGTPSNWTPWFLPSVPLVVHPMYSLNRSGLLIKTASWKLVMFGTNITTLQLLGTYFPELVQYKSSNYSVHSNLILPPEKLLKFKKISAIVKM